jgi:amidase
MDLTAIPAAELSAAIHARTVSCREVVTAHYDRIAARNPALHALVAVRDRDDALAEAAVCDDELVAGRSRGWMHGFPHAVKDLTDAAGLPTTMGSRLFADRIAAGDSLLVQRMRAAGCLVIAKSNVPEFGLGSHTFNDVYGVTRNPFDPTRTAGGSSGGAAVALATGMVPVADGSDYMGSLRNPAGWCDVVGFRPSQGRVPSYPSTDAYLAQLATDGPMGRNALDVALLLGTQAGADPRAPLALPGRLDGLDGVAAARRTLAGDPSGVRIGWLSDLDGHLATEPGILAVCQAALARLGALGARVEPARFGLPPEQVWEAWLVWRALLVSATLSSAVRTASDRALVKPEALWELDRGVALTGAAIAAASAVRTAFFRDTLRLFDAVDVLALPSAQVWPFPVEQRWPDRIGGRAMDTYHRWMEVASYATFAGLPAISVPAGFDERGLPMGLQLIGRPGADVEVLRLAHAYDGVRPQRPPT